MMCDKLLLQTACLGRDRGVGRRNASARTHSASAPLPAGQEPPPLPLAAPRTRHM